MESWSQLSSDAEGPLRSFSNLSLFPRTLKSLANTLPRPHESEDLQHTHNVFKSMPLQFQSETLEQVKGILDSSSEFLNPTITVNADPGDEFKHVEANPIAIQRERRPGLGGKRARFSFNPYKNDYTASSVPSFEVGKYQNPESFFQEFEKFENARKEWQKQTGSNLVHADQNQRSARPRRPGISGQEERKQVKYKHLYSTDTISQPTVEEENLSPSGNSFHERTTIADITSPHQELDGSIKNKEKSVDELLGELLSCTQGELDGDGAVNLLEERLKIKPIDIGKICLPELQDFRRNDLKISRKGLLKPRTVLSDIQNVIKEMRTETTPQFHRTPPLSKSPLSSIPLLLKQKSLVDPQKDHFSFPITNDLSAADVSNTSMSTTSVGDIAGPSVNSVSNSPIRHAERFHSDLEGNMDNSTEKSARERNLSGDQIDVDMPTAEQNHNDYKGEDEQQRDTNTEQINHSLKIPTPERLNDISSQLDQSETSAAETLVEIEILKPGEGAQKQHNAGKESNGTQEVDNKENETAKSAQEAEERNTTKMHTSNRTRGEKRIQPMSRESKAFSRRKSLAAAGTSWEAGVRRSKRIRSRPLEYWKGERFLYGRVHQSLATVIGIKYVSPAKGKGDPGTLKVKSFVSDEHKELLQAAALH